MILLCVLGFLLHAAAGLTWGETFWAMVWTALCWTAFDFVRGERAWRRFNYPRRGPVPSPEPSRKEPPK